MQKADLAISKLIILDIVGRLPAVTCNRLVNLSLETLYMDYFTYMQAWQELVRDKLIQVSVRKNETETDAGGHPVERCDITRQGQSILSTLEHKIPLHIKTYLHPLTRDWQKSIRREQDVRAEMTPDANGQFQVTLSQHDGVRDQVRLEVTIPDRQMAKRICQHWKNQPSSIYLALLALLTGETTSRDRQAPAEISDSQKTAPIQIEPARPYPDEQSLVD